jgi:catechol 2,3-dioxygenase-like lactoylglutathione lyase family enzyme
MNRFSNLALRVFFKVVILSFAALVMVAVGAIFHVQGTSRTAGIAFFVTAVGVFLIFERALFPTVYGRAAWSPHKRRAKNIFHSAGDVAVDVRDAKAARQWYSDRLGLPYFSSEVEGVTVGLGYSANDMVLYLNEVSGNVRPNARAGRPPIMFARKLGNAHEYLSSQGVSVSPIQSDSGGNHFFRFRDLEGNELEVCQQT